MHGINEKTAKIHPRTKNHYDNTEFRMNRAACLQRTAVYSEQLMTT